MPEPTQQPQQEKRQAVPMTSGIFEKGAAPPNPSESVPGSPSPRVRPTAQPRLPEQEKPNFPDPFAIQSEMMKNIVKPKKDDKSEAEDDINAINSAGAMADSAKEDADLMKISEEDVKIAEQLIFNGYAECPVRMTNLPAHEFVICSTSGEELTFIDEMAYDKMKSVKQNPDGTIDIPDSVIKSMRSALFIALSYRGMDGKDIAQEPVVQINTIKRAIIKMAEQYGAGDIKIADDLKMSIKKALAKRASLIKRLPSAMIDFLSDEKYKFDVKMLTIMSEKKILPKS